MPEEPSILDYLKSKLKFWERGGKIEIPAEAEPPEESSTENLQGGGNRTSRTGVGARFRGEADTGEEYAT